MMQKITGVIPAMVTPFDKEGNIDGQAIRQIVGFLKDQQVDGLYLTGSTGEGFLMSPEERKQVIEITAEAADGTLPFIVHAGAIGTKVTIDLARHAEACGAAAVSSVPPFYWKFGPENIEKYYREIAESVEVPVIMYNIALAGVMDLSTIRRMAEIPNVRGIKYTAPTQFEMLELREQLGPDFVIYSGSDEMAMSGLGYGADGIIGTFYNILPDLYLDLYRASLRKDLDAMLDKQKIANQVILTCLRHEMIPTVKAMMRWIGIDAGYARSPFRQFTREEELALMEEFRPIRELPGAEKVLFLSKEWTLT